MRIHTLFSTPLAPQIDQFLVAVERSRRQVSAAWDRCEGILRTRDDQPLVSIGGSTSTQRPR